MLRFRGIIAAGSGVTRPARGDHPSKLPVGAQLTAVLAASFSFFACRLLS